MAAKPATPFWSVVIPLYNKQDFIQATLRSVLAQVGEDDFEVLVIDDGSTDLGSERVVELADKRVRLIRQSNSGVSAARNCGIREARGAWIAFLDADDLWRPHALAAYRKLMSAFPDVEVVAGAYVRVPSGEVVGFRFQQEPVPSTCHCINNLPAEFLRYGMRFNTSSIAVRRSLFSRVEPWFPEGEAMGEDLDFWFRIAEQSAIKHTSNIIAIYRVALDDSLMGKYRDIGLLPVWQRMRQRALDGGMPSEIRTSSLRLVAEMEVTTARRYGKAGRRIEAWRHLFAAHSAARGHRWWVTLITLLSGSASLIQKLR